MAEETSFDSLGLIEPLLQSLREQGYERPTPIQAGAIPMVLAGRDLLGTARTGTGKTAAFALPALQMMELSIKPLTPRQVRVLVLTPTRELAAQVEESFRAYGSGTGLKFALAFGGVGKAPQVRALSAGVDVLVATPGRLLDLAADGAVTLDKVELFVLDEADRMLDMGFIHDMKKVFKLLPKKRQTLLFSATMPDSIKDIAREILSDPVRVAVDPVSAPASGVEQGIYYVDKDKKRALILAILTDGTVDRALVFTRTKHLANRVARFLSLAGVSADAIHANKSQTHRTRVLSDFKAGKLRVLVATDIAARGIDIDELPFVINFEIPNEPETYVHRVGRTARAGLSGSARSFCAPEEKPLVKAIERLMGKQIPTLELPELPELPESLLKADARPLNGRSPDSEGGGWGHKRHEGAEGQERRERAPREKQRRDGKRDGAGRDAPQREAPGREASPRDEGNRQRPARGHDRSLGDERNRASIQDELRNLTRGADGAGMTNGPSRQKPDRPRVEQARQRNRGEGKPSSIGPNGEDFSAIPPGVSPFHPEPGHGNRGRGGRRPYRDGQGSDRPLSAKDIPNISDEEALRRAAANAAQPGIIPFAGGDSFPRGNQGQGQGPRPQGQGGKGRRRRR